MELLLKKIGLFGICCLALANLYGQTGFSTALSPAEISKDEYTTLRILIENASDIQQLTPPDLKNFMLVSGPNQESGMSAVNGTSVKQFLAISFVLKPKAPGNFTIGPAIAKISGKIYKSSPLKLVVKNSLSGNTARRNAPLNSFPGFDPYAASKPATSFNDYIFHKGENISDKVKKNMLLRLEVDKTSCYVGEPVVATYKLYTRLKSESKLIQSPSFNGFSVIDLQQPNITGYTQEKLNGRDYNVYIIRKAQLYPLQAGNIELEPAELDNNIQFIKEGYADRPMTDMLDMFDDFAQSSVPSDAIINHSENLVSNPLSILVKPLPGENKPASFKGAVGNFTVEANLEKTNFTTNEAGKFIIKIQGNGNLQMITAPEIIWPAAVESFEPKVYDDLVKTTVPVSGSKVFEYPFSVNAEGSYTLPAIEFSYFDPKSAKYKTTTAGPFSFTVLKGSGRTPTISLPAAQPSPGFLNSIFNHRRLLISFIACVILAGLIFWLKRDGRKEKEAKIIQEEKKDDVAEHFDQMAASTLISQQNPLSKSEKYLYQGDPSVFYTILNKELRTYLSQQFSIGATDVSAKTISAVMDKGGFPNATILKLVQLIQDIDMQLYTPFEKNKDLQGYYQCSMDVIQEINSHDSIRRQ